MEKMPSMTQEKNDQLIQAGLKIGEGVRLWGSIDMRAPNVDVSVPDVVIGNYTVIGEATKLLSHCPSKSIDNGWLGIHIGHDTYIGYRCIILPGVKIGDRVLIGAGSVVTKNIPNDVVVAGNPAKIIKKRSKFEILRTALLTRENKTTVNIDPDWEAVDDQMIQEIFDISQDEWYGKKPSWDTILEKLRGKPL